MRPHFDSYAITIDVDWAPDFWITEVEEALTVRGIRSTWFITHDSPAVRRLLGNPLIECGIHPNFLPFSSHGTDESSVLAHMTGLVPEARSVRMHALFQHSRLLFRLMEEFSFIAECSLYLPNSPDLQPHHLEFSKSGKFLVRIPYFWEDDVECMIHRTGWNPQASSFHPSGLKVYNFHPAYIGLNCDDLSGYEQLKKKIAGIKQLQNCTEEDVAGFVNQGIGVKSCFMELLDILAEKDPQTQREIADTYISWLNSNEH